MSSAASRPLGFHALLDRFRPGFGRAVASSRQALPVQILPVLVLLLCAMLGAGCADITPKPQTEAVTPDAPGGSGTALAARSDGSAVTPAPRSDYGSAASASPDWSAAEKQAASFISSAPVYFHYDSAALTDSAKAVLRQKAAKLLEFPNLLLLINGHCDERGTAAYNDALGARRAEAALNYLADQGISRSRMDAASYGTRRPLVPGRGENIWSQNRRDEFSVSKK